MKKISRRSFMKCAAASAAALGLAGCSGASSAAAPAASTGSSAAASAATGDVKTVSILMYTDWYKAGWEALEQYVSDNAASLGFKLDISKIEGGDQGDQVIQTKFATDDLPDIIQIYKPQWVEANTSNGLDKLVDLTGLDCLAEYDENALDGTYLYNGKYYSVPVDTTVLQGVFYNKKVFSDAGVSIPTTWDELLSVCDTLKAAGVVPVYYSAKDVWSVQPPVLSGVLLDAAERNTTTSDLMNQISANKLKFADCTNFVDMIQHSKDLIDQGYVNETYLSDTVDNAHQALVDGTCAMYINGTWCADAVESEWPDQADNIGAFAVPTPGGKNYINMFVPYSLALTTACKDPELGKKVINFIASTEAQQVYADAQPGLYLNKNVTSTIPSATKDLKAIMDSGMSMLDWEEIVKYSYGNLGEVMLDYYTGTLKNAADVAATLDSETEKSAKAKGDSNWN